MRPSLRNTKILHIRVLINKPICFPVNVTTNGRLHVRFRRSILLVAKPIDQMLVVKARKEHKMVNNLTCKLPVVAEKYEISLVMEGYNPTTTEVWILRKQGLYHPRQQGRVNKENSWQYMQ